MFAAVRISAVVVRFAAFLQRPCNKNATLLQGVRAADLRPSKDNARIVRKQPQHGKSYVNCPGVSRLTCSNIACLHIAAL